MSQESVEYAPHDDQSGLSHLPPRRASRPPLEGHPPACATPCLPSALTGGRLRPPADPTLARPSEPAQYQPLPPCHPTGPPRDPASPRCVAAGAALMSRPPLAVAAIVHQYGAAFL